MPFLYPHRRGSQSSSMPTSSWDDYRAALPSRPSRVEKRSSYRESSRRSQSRDARSQRPRIESQERRRERRERRRDEDPEREARRAERRRARRAEREATRRIEEKRAAADATDESDKSSSPRRSSRRISQADPATPPQFTTTPSIARDGYEPVRRQSHTVAERDFDRRQSPRRPKRAARAQSWTSYEDDRYYDEKRHAGTRSSSMFDELDWYKRTTMPEPATMHRDEKIYRRRRWCVFGSLAATIIVLIIIIVAAVEASRNKYHYTPSAAQVNNTAAFTTGGATHNSINDTKDGVPAGPDAYIYYHGNASAFPPSSRWISFDDMWTNNLVTLQQSCGWLQWGADDSPEEIANIYNAIQDRANASLVDHRLIFALILQESHGCVRVPATTSSGGVHNPGLMQSHHGHGYDAKHSALSIMNMVQDGTQGTLGKENGGDGLVQLLNTYGDPYKAARGYNSGYIPSSGDLSEAAGATACYVSDVANRLTGWVKAASTCPGGASS